MLMVTVALGMALMMALSGPAFAQAGCQASGQAAAAEAKEFRPIGTNLLVGFGLVPVAQAAEGSSLLDFIAAEKQELCAPPAE